MKSAHWHILANRLAAERPYWTWAKVCAELQRRSVEARKKPAPIVGRKPYAD